MNNSRLALVCTGAERRVEQAKTGDKHGTIYASADRTATIGRRDGLVPEARAVIGSP